MDNRCSKCENKFPYSLKELRELELRFIDRIWGYRESGDYTDLVWHYGNDPHSAMDPSVRVLEVLWKEIPENQKYEIVFAIFTNLKSPASQMEYFVRDMRKYRPNTINGWLRNKVDQNGYITVFRGTGKKEANPELSLSWTLDKEIAAFFASKYWLTKTQTDTFYIYRGQIHIDDVIHYTNCRNESAIAQYGSVKNIQEECFPV